ncbi:MAG TPA: tryptophan synthase subunit alpha [Dehalococcoidia bacterium]|nr:tryptophan synthase subunit alpha [Dehalococcoidia bacterium]
MGRIEAAFQRLRSEGRTGLIAFLTCGFPTREETADLVRALEEGGADLIEIGVPFSDPLADGKTIQQADEIALAQGVGLGDCLGVVAELRTGGLETPLVAMGYFNPILALGEREFAARAAAAGLDGVIVVDLPPEEADSFQAVCREHGLDLIFLVAPTTTDQRLERIGRAGSGFIYCVSLTGTTGARSHLASGLPEFMARVRRHTELPLAIGFGISTAEQFKAAGELADAVVIGTAIIDVIDRADARTRSESVREYVEVVSGRRRANV